MPEITFAAHYPVAQIQIGQCLRRDLGDIDALASSISRHGLLHPIVICEDGVLVSGARRLAAIRQLEWHHVPVCIARAISGRLQVLLAIQDEMELVKPRSPVECAELYEELHRWMQLDAEARQRRTQFGSPTRSCRSTGPVDSTGPRGDSRSRAAQAVTHTDSHERLDRVLEIRDLAHDPQTPPWLAQQAAKALEVMDTTGKVSTPYRDVKAAEAQSALQAILDDPAVPDARRQWAEKQLDELRNTTGSIDAIRLSKRILAELRSTAGESKSANAPAADLETQVFAKQAARLFERIRADWAGCDPFMLAAALSAADWEVFRQAVSGGIGVLTATETALELGAAQDPSPPPDAEA